MLRNLPMDCFCVGVAAFKKGALSSLFSIGGKGLHFCGIVLAGSWKEAGMRAALMVNMGLCLPQGHFAFHAKVCPTMTSVVATSTAGVSMPMGGAARSGRSFKRGRTQMAGHFATVTATDCAGGSTDEKSPWAENFELDSQGKVMLKGLLFSETQELMASLGLKPGRAEVLSGWLYHGKRLIRDLDDTAGDDGDKSRRIGKATREKIRAVATADGGLRLEDVQLAADGTRKLVSVLTSGEGVGKKVETVLIPMLRGPQREPRYTVCVSSQVGCAMNCQFCYTGRLGLMANLQTSQIVEQVVAAKRVLESIGDSAPVTGVVFMGMGEPFDNYDRVMRAVKIITDPRAGIRLKASSVTVSTVGLVPEIERFCSDPDNGASLAISLHAVTDQVRDTLIPVNRRFSLGQLSKTLRTHFPRISTLKTKKSEDHPLLDQPSSAEEISQEPSAATPVKGLKPAGEEEGEEDPVMAAESSKPRRPRRKPRILAVEYTLLRGVNDSLADAERLAEWLEGVACVVNLITFNPHHGTPFSMSSLESSEAFRQALLEKGQLCTFRDSRGDDGMAACGQLGGESMVGPRARKPVPVAWVPGAATPAGASV